VSRKAVQEFLVVRCPGSWCVRGIRRFPDAADLLQEVAEDVLAHVHFFKEHRR
jgi:hypothetical protein